MVRPHQRSLLEIFRCNLKEDLGGAGNISDVRVRVTVTVTVTVKRLG
jgi:hypothetical protein